MMVVKIRLKNLLASGSDTWAEWKTLEKFSPSLSAPCIWYLLLFSADNADFKRRLHQSVSTNKCATMLIMIHLIQGDCIICATKLIMIIWCMIKSIIMLLSKVIAAEGEHKASRALRHAAEVIADSPAALQVDLDKQTQTDRWTDTDTQTDTQHTVADSLAAL